MAASVGDVLTALRNYDVTASVRYRYQRNNRTGQQVDIPYLEWHSVADILDEVCPRWEKTVYPAEIHGNFAVVRVRVTIYGADGTSVSREAIGNEPLDHVSDPFCAAESQAFKRAAAFLGVGRSLYDTNARQSLPQQAPANQPVQQQHSNRPQQNDQFVRDLPITVRDQTVVQFENKCARNRISLDDLKRIVQRVCGANFPVHHDSIEFLVLNLPTTKAREVFAALDGHTKVA